MAVLAMAVICSSAAFEWPAGDCRGHSHSRSYSQPKRSSHAKTEFKHTHPCPSTGKGTRSCTGYIIDHVKPLKRSGTDAPSNMQWQITQDAKAKDEWEEYEYRRHKRPLLRNRG